MQQLELTEKHVDKLYEMSRKLFPKNFIGKENPKELFAIFTDGQMDYQDEKGNVESIHWYEFINTYLAEKVLNPNPKLPNRNQKQIFCDFFWNNNVYWFYTQPGSLPVVGLPDVVHPIDYLYKQFKLLKLK